MKSKHQGIEALTIRRAVVADTDKVRYRVYSTPTEFIAVIAESALMAVKVSGISKPHKIVRDLPTEGIAIEAKKMAVRDDTVQRVTMPTSKVKSESRLLAEVAPREPDAKQGLFRPMNIGDLQNAGMVRARILPPELLNEIIEQHSKATLPPIPVAEPQAAEASPVVMASPPPASAAPDLCPKDRVLEAASEVLPSSSSTASADEKVLSPEEVEKLLNG